MPRKLEVYQPTGRSIEELNIFIAEQSNQESVPTATQDSIIPPTLIESKSVPVQETITLTSKLSDIMKIFTQEPSRQQTLNDICQSTGTDLFSLIPCLNSLKGKTLITCSDSGLWGLSPKTDISKLVFTQAAPDQNTSNLSPNTPPKLIENEKPIIIPPKLIDIPQPRQSISESPKRIILEQSPKKPEKHLKKPTSFQQQKGSKTVDQNHQSKIEQEILDLFRQSVQLGFSPFGYISEHLESKKVKSNADLFYIFKKLELKGFLIHSGRNWEIVHQNECSITTPENKQNPIENDPFKEKVEIIRAINSHYKIQFSIHETAEKIEVTRLSLLWSILKNYPLFSQRDIKAIFDGISGNEFSIQNFLLAFIAKNNQDTTRNFIQKARQSKELFTNSPIQEEIIGNFFKKHQEYQEICQAYQRFLISSESTSTDIEKPLSEKSGRPRRENPETGLTKSEETLYQLISELIQENKPITVRELSKISGLKSLDSVYQKLEKLTSQGYLKRSSENTYRNKRSWALTNKTLNQIV